MRLLYRCYLRVQWSAVCFQLYKRRKYSSIYQKKYSNSSNIWFHKSASSIKCLFLTFM